MKNTVIKTLNNSIFSRLIKYPSSPEELENNWNKLPLNFMAMRKGKWVFPYRYTGNQLKQASGLWENYGLLKGKKLSTSEEFTEETNLRISALIRIKDSLSAEQSQLNSAINEYFSLVENFRLSALEEVISGLSFLHLGDDARWNNQLIKIYLFQGSNQLVALTEYLFRQNQNFSYADMNLSIEKIRSTLEISNINTDWFEQSVIELWRTTPKITNSELTNYSIVQDQWLSVKSSSDMILFLPFSINQELQKVTSTLQSQGILEDGDSISLQKPATVKPFQTINTLPYQIHRKQWQRQSEQQNYFFFVKIILAVVFSLSLLILVSLINFRTNKKLEFLQLRENFINLVSHELKTPLASMRIMVETLQKRDKKNLPIQDYPLRIISEVDRLWFMIDNLLSINQIKAGELELNIDKVNLHSMVNRVSEKFSEQKLHSLDCNNQLPKECFCMVDQVLFELVLINLFSNATKYCERSTVEISISIHNQQQILFTDNGCGISPSNWQDVFNIFYRERSNNTKPGTGVGLSLCRQIMQLHHAEIKILSSTEKGTTWIIDCPGLSIGI